MQGLRTQESNKFNKFFELVQSRAGEGGCVFFCDCGEGRDFETPEMEGEDLSGWLIPIKESKKFEKEFVKGRMDDDWYDSLVFCTWEADGESIDVRFKTF